MKNVMARCVPVFVISLLMGYLPVLFLEQGVVRLLFVMFVSVAAAVLSVWFVGISGQEREIIKGHGLAFFTKRWAA